MPSWLLIIAKNLPLTFFSGAVRAIINDGAGPRAISHELVGMMVWCVVLLTLATLTFRFADKQPG